MIGAGGGTEAISVARVKGGCRYEAQGVTPSEKDFPAHKSRLHLSYVRGAIQL